MQKFAQKYTIISLFEDIEAGYEYSAADWPLHSTLADTFAINWKAETLKKKIEDIAKLSARVETKAFRDEYFGPDKEIHVILIEKTDELKLLHYRIVEELKNGGVTFNDPQFSEAGFLPHSTVQKHAAIKLGENVTFSNLTLVDMRPNNDPQMRKILKIVSL